MLFIILRKVPASPSLLRVSIINIILFVNDFFYIYLNNCVVFLFQPSLVNVIHITFGMLK